MKSFYDWKIGDKFRFIRNNSSGGPEFGSIGEVGQIIDIYENSGVDGIGCDFEFKFLEQNFCGDLYRLPDYNPVGRFKDIALLVVDYKADQMADAEEDLL